MGTFVRVRHDADHQQRCIDAQQQRRGDEKRRSARRRTGTAIYLVCVVLGSVLDAPLVWNLSDLFNALMVFPNLIALLALIVVLAVHSLLLPGAAEGMKFYLLPSAESIRTNGLGNIITAAMNQAFFTLSLGIAAMEIFGSYMSREHTLAGEATRICALDTFVAIMAGVIIFPACFSYGVQPDAGPPLIFQTLPSVFVNMEGGRLWGTLFFLFMTFASFSTVLAVFENLLAFAVDTFGISRKKASLIGCIAMLVLSMPCILGFNVWGDLQLIGARGVQDSEDFLVSNLLLPIGSAIYLLFCVSRWGWGFENYLAEANTGKGPKLPRWLRPYFRYVLPLLIIVILVQGLL